MSQRQLQLLAAKLRTDCQKQDATIRKAENPFPHHPPCSQRRLTEAYADGAQLLVLREEAKLRGISL